MLAETMRDVEDMIPSPNDFVQKGEDGETIIREDAALLIDAFGSRIAQSAKMSMIQGLGAQAKIDKGLKGAMAQDIVENKMPIINLIGDVLGFNTKQYISKHPEALGQIAQIAAPYLQGKGLNVQSLMGGGMSPSQPQGNNGVGGYG